jgi:hypothetical protein
MKTLLVTSICAMLIGSQAFLFTPNSYSQEFGYDLSGVIYEQPAYYFIDHGNLLNPNNEILDLPKLTNKTWGKINLNLNYDIFKFNTQFRPTLFFQEGASDKFDFYTDEAYLDMNFGNKVFLYAGKRNFVEGVTYGAYPTDFLGQFKKLDYSLREEERRVQREGNYLVGGDVFFKNITLSALYAPKIDRWQDEKDRVLLKGKLLVESINTDMAVHLFYGDIPGVGLDISSTVSDNLVLYTGSALRRGSQKLDIIVTSEGDNNNPRTFKFIPPDNHKVYPKIVVGGSYTFGDGTNLIAEYIYNGDGYSKGDWKQFKEFVKYNNESYKNNFFQGLAVSNLVSGSSIMKIREMRKNYAFFRLSNSKLIENLDSQLVFQVGLNDGSFLLYPSIDYKVTKNLVAGIYSTIYGGKRDSEFGMHYWHADVGLLFKYFFSVPNYLKSGKKSM